MKAFITDYDLQILPGSEEIIRLAGIYVSSGKIPERFLADAVHIAAATIGGVDFIISLNCKHIVRHKTIIETKLSNAREGYERVFIHMPAEVKGYD